jgi:hypothetical protein
VDITIYLPDELGQWAKENNLPLSRMLRDAVTEQRQQGAAVAKTLEDIKTYDVQVEMKGSYDTYTARIHGALIGTDERNGGDVTFYLGKNEQVFVYDERESKLYTDVSDEDLEAWLSESSEETHIEVMTALGREAVIDYGL